MAVFWKSRPILDRRRRQRPGRQSEHLTTNAGRVKCERRCRSDLTDVQWEICEPVLPLIKSPGRIPKHSRRAIVNAILYVVRSDFSWRQLPIDFPP
jgi:hypothetical protein